ncbi:endonuclease-reverse transcriptase domain-containing protein [Hirsutella rhossiliensis]
MCEGIEEREHQQRLKETLNGQNEIIRDQQEIIRKQKEEAEKQEKTNQELILQWEDIKQQMRDQLKHVQQQLEATIVGSAVTPPSTFAEVARSSPSPQHNTVRSVSSGSTAASNANELFCMIDTSRAIESEVRTKEGQATWRDEVELQRVKEAAQKTAVTGARVMRDQLYPVKVDNVNRTAILDGEGNILQGAAEALGAENNVSIGKITWLSNKETSKAYGSMVVYVTKKNDAKKLLDGKYFDLAGESACTNPFEPRKGPMQCFNCQEMGHKAFRCKKPQLNVRKREPVQQSLMNDEDLKDYGVLAVSEPYARMIDGKVVTSPRMHSNWTRILPTHMSDGPWPIRSMLWVRDDVEVVQMPMPSADLTAAVLRLPERSVLVVSVYVEGQSTEALKSTTGLLHDLIQRFRQGSGARTDVVLAGDFNSHDLLWGGDDVSVQRQGEAGPIIDLMNEHGLRSLLPRGTKTWQRKDQESTIDLVLTTSELADEVATCAIHPTDHGSDHRAIQTTFDITMPERSARPRLLFKNAPWNLIRTRVKDNLRLLPWAVDVQTQTDQLMRIVLEAIHELTPRARPSPYAKRWWTKDLTQLRRTHTFWRNQARTQRRGGQPRPDLERRAKEAAKEFHDAIRHQRKAHWDDFLSDDANIWKATKYLKAGKSTTGDKVPPLRKGDGSTTEDKADQADELLIAFFPPLPARIEDEGVRPQRKAVPMPGLTLGEIEEKVMTAKPWKAPGEDELPTAVWRQLWPVTKDRIFALFDASLRDGVVPRQWKSAKIVPLKKPHKDDYTVAKAWRPISLLSTLGKILEAVVAERISYAVETYGLLPANHFGARKRRSAEQALLLLQEQAYKAWRNHKVLSLISFDVKGAYNGVCKDRLLERMKARGIPAKLRRIKAESGSIAFVDDYSAWVTGPTAEANREGIQAIIDDALEWEVRSGATFETEKTTIVHFTRATVRSSDGPFLIRGQEVRPKKSAKILGVIMDEELRFQDHMMKAAASGLSAAMGLRRLKGPLSAPCARFLVSLCTLPYLARLHT